MKCEWVISNLNRGAVQLECIKILGLDYALALCYLKLVVNFRTFKPQYSHRLFSHKKGARQWSRANGRFI